MQAEQVLPEKPKEHAEIRKKMEKIPASALQPPAEKPKEPLHFYDDFIMLDGDEEITVNLVFNSAPLLDVIPSFADALGFNFLADSDLKGVVTLNIDQKMTRRELWNTFDKMLNLAGAGVTQRSADVRGRNRAVGAGRHDDGVGSGAVYEDDRMPRFGWHRAQVGGADARRAQIVAQSFAVRTDGADVRDRCARTRQRDALIEAFAARKERKGVRRLGFSGRNEMVERVDAVDIDGAEVVDHCFVLREGCLRFTGARLLVAREFFDNRLVHGPGDFQPCGGDVPAEFDDPFVADAVRGEAGLEAVAFVRRSEG